MDGEISTELPTISILIKNLTLPTIEASLMKSITTVILANVTALLYYHKARLLNILMIN
jgi:hypothetical protein